ncbi:MAG: response regulator [Nitrospirota bacterium]
MTTPVKIMIVEDHDDTRENLMLLLNDYKGFKVVYAARTGEEAVKAAKDLDIDVILMDIDLPGKINGVEAIREIREYDNDVEIIVLTIFEDNKNIFASLKNGARGYITKSSSHNIISAIEEVIAGGAPMSPSIARRVVQEFQAIERLLLKKEYSLTRTERKVLQLMERGATYKNCAEELYVSLHTVQTHIKNIYRKLEVNSKIAAVMKAREERII